MSGNKWFFMFSAFLMCASGEAAKLGFTDSKEIITNGRRYISGPLPLLRLKKFGFDVEHLSLRAMESPSPAPSPSPSCEPERMELTKACDDLKEKEYDLKEACKKVKRAENKLNRLQMKLDMVKQKIAPKEEEQAALKQEINTLENVDTSTLTAAEEEWFRQVIRKTRRDLEKAEKRLRDLKNKEDRIDSDVERAEEALSQAKEAKQKAKDAVTQATIRKREARRTLDDRLSP